MQVNILWYDSERAFMADCEKFQKEGTYVDADFQYQEIPEADRFGGSYHFSGKIEVLCHA